MSSRTFFYLKVLRKAFKEYWAALLVGCIWTICLIFNQHIVSIPMIMSIFISGFLATLWVSEKYFKLCSEIRQEENVNDLIGYSKGADNCCYWLISTINNHNNTGLEVVINNGGYPLYDVSARFMDLDIFEERKSSSLSEISRSQFFQSFGTILPGCIMPTGFNPTFDLGESDSRRVNVYWTTRSGRFTQLIRFKKVDGAWLFATKVCKEGECTVLFEKIEEGYPIGSSGSIDWS